MTKFYTVLVLIFTFSFATHAQNFPTTSWSDHTDVSWYDASQTTYTINSPEALAGLSQLVMQGNTFADKTLNIVADLNLDAHLWTPIGPNVNTPFSGTLDGGNMTISNLWIDLPTEDFVGLFGQTTGATIANLNIDGAQITADDTAGVIVGNFSTNSAMMDCHVKNATLIAADYNIGGLTGAVLINSSITRSSFIGVVSGLSQVGGISGTAYNVSEISECYSEGTVSGGYLIGGVVGYCTFAFTPSENSVNNCYSRSDVSATAGRAGGIYGSGEFTLILRNSYATGVVTAPEFQGGVIGAVGGDITIENVYFDLETSQNTEGIGGFLGAPGDYDIEGKTSAEMKTTAFLEALNAGSTGNPWSMDASLNDGYPVLTNTLSVAETSINSVSVIAYPTVFTDQITFSSDLNLSSVKIYNLTGALVYESDLRNSNNIQVGTLAAGVYLMNIDTDKGIVTKKIIRK